MATTAPSLSLPAAAPARPSDRGRTATRPATVATVLVVAAVTALALAVRVWGIDFAPYHGDEGYNYVVPAVTYFSGDYNPHRFDNPTLLSYVFHGAYQVWYQLGRAAGAFQSPYDFVAQFYRTPLVFYVIARWVVALMGALTVPLVYATASQVYGRRAGVLAALFLALAFLHARDSHFAVTDVPLTFWAVFCVYLALQWQQAQGFWAWFFALGTGLAFGLAFATKYTALYVIGVIAWAGLSGVRKGGDGWGARAGMIVAALSWGVVVFAGACPYCVIDAETSLASVRMLASLGASSFIGLRLTDQPGWLFYLNTLAWGVGWPLIALAALGLARALWRDRPEDWLLLFYPLTLAVVLSTQHLLFARFIIPTIPFLAIFAGQAADALARALARAAGPPGEAGTAGGVWPARALAAGLAALALSWPAASLARADYLWTQTDTRDQARTWLRLHLPYDAPAVRDWHTPCLSSPGKLCPGDDGRVYDIELIPRAGVGSLPLDDYRRRGVQYFVVSSFVRAVPYVDVDAERVRLQTYRDLEAEAELVAAFRPYSGGDADEPPFTSDMSYGPTTSLFRFERPGPTIRIYRLRYPPPERPLPLPRPE